MLYTKGILLKVFCRTVLHTSGLCSFYQNKIRVQYHCFINLSIRNSPFTQFVFTTYKHLLPLALEASFYIRHIERISQYVSVPCAFSLFYCLCIWNSCHREWGVKNHNLLIQLLFSHMQNNNLISSVLIFPVRKWATKKNCWESYHQLPQHEGGGRNVQTT